jgi:hypothetical protein
VLAFGCTAWLLLLQHRAGLHGPAHQPALLLHVLRDGVLALPLVAVAALAVARGTRAGRDGDGALPVVLAHALAASAALAAATGVQHVLFGGNHVHASLSGHMAQDGLLALVAAVPLTAAFLFLTAPVAQRQVRRTARRVAAVALSLALPVGGLLAAAQPVSAQAQTAAEACTTGGAVDRSFDVTAIDVDIPLNRFGDHDPGGKMYTLTKNLGAVRAQEKSQQVSIGLRDDPIQPLVIRANMGECIEIAYQNLASGGDFGLHIDGLAFSTAGSGDAIGNNVSSQPKTGGTATYRYYIPNEPSLEGSHYIRPGAGYRAAVDHGLFGSLTVELPGSTYWNSSKSGQPLESGWEAIIVPGDAKPECRTGTTMGVHCAFREAVKLHHEVGNDNERLLTKTGDKTPIQDDTTGSYRPGAFALNYRSEPFRNRLLGAPKEKSHAYSSYTFGDPATPMPRGYLGDPTKFRIMHAGGEKFHVYHLHGGGDRWRLNPVADTTYNYSDTGLRKDPATVASPSTRLDSQSIGPGESYNLEMEGGAGGVQQSVGDFLFHCHIAKHYVSGMWSFWRVYNTLQADLVPLPDRAAPAQAVSAGDLIGLHVRGAHDAASTDITAANLDSWLRPQLPPAGVPHDGQDASVWDWTIDGSDPAHPRYLGAPEDKTDYPDSAKVVPGHPNLLLGDRLVGDRPEILFDPTNGRPAYPLFRTHIGERPPFTPNGHTGTPYLGNNAEQTAKGATDPWSNRTDGLCPAGRKLRTFNVVAIEKSIQRSAKKVDPEGKLFVLAKDKEDLLADKRPSDPLALRANQGDCVAVTLTNEIPDAGAFDGWSKTTMHIHHVQFDIQGSDGVSAGFAYEHSVRPYEAEDATLTSAVKPGDSTISLTSVTKLVGNDAAGNARHPFVAVGQGTESIEVRQVESVDLVAKTVTLTQPLAKDHPVGQWAGTEFIQYRWYPDVLLDNIFWHDHVDGIHGWGHGLVGQLIVEPFGSTYHDPVTGEEVDSGTLVDIHVPPGDKALVPGMKLKSFRELALWTIDDNDRSDYSTLNLKAAPFKDRPDAANRFSSFKYGDPMTPLPRLYKDDPLVIRTINVNPSIDTLHIQGGRFPTEMRYLDENGPEATLQDTIHYGVSEKYTLLVNADAPGMSQAPGDYLYSNGVEAKFRQGAWGIMRVLPGHVPDLKPLPEDSSTETFALPRQTGGTPPAGSPGDPCPAGAPQRSFAVSAVDLPTGGSGGLLASAAYVPTADAGAVRAGTRSVEPLVLHAAAGECVEVTFTNERAAVSGFSMAKLRRAAGSAGVNVGFGPEQTVAPGQSRTFRYFVDSPRLGTATISDLTGESSGKLGLYGSLVVAPQGTTGPTTFTDPVTGEPRDIGSQVVVHVPGSSRPHYRDVTVALADDDEHISQDFMPYPTNAETGKSGLNYRAAPAGDGPDAFRNPGQVPVIEAYAGDPMTVHTYVAPGSEQAHVFSLGGLSYPNDPHVKHANFVQNLAYGPMESIDAEIAGGAGGWAHSPGDYFYGDLRRPFTQIGVWGLQRVHPKGAAGCTLLKVDGRPCTEPDPEDSGSGGSGSTDGLPGTPAAPGGTGTTGTGSGASGASGPSLTAASGPAAAASGPATKSKAKARVPSAPRVGVALSGRPRGAVTATARWRAPASSGGRRITGYTVVALRLGPTGKVLSRSTSVRLGATKRSLAMVLRRTGRYRFQVRAHSAAGASQWSARSNRVTAR